MNVDWGTFKAFVTARAVSIQYVLLGDTYWLKAFDGPFELSTTIFKHATPPAGGEQEDFETNFISTANITYTDGEGSALNKIKMAPKGWTYQLRSIGVKTSTINSLSNNDHNGNDLGGCTLKFYKANGDEITDQGVADTDCVKTVLDIEPAYTYEVIGGWLSVQNNVTDNIKIYVIGAPDIPEYLGGSKLMVANLDARYIDPSERVRLDGRTPKHMTYDATYHTSKLRLVLTHAVGVAENFQISLEIFKQ